MSVRGECRRLAPALSRFVLPCCSPCGEWKCRQDMHYLGFESSWAGSVPGTTQWSCCWCGYPSLFGWHYCHWQCKPEQWYYSPVDNMVIKFLLSDANPPHCQSSSHTSNQALAETSSAQVTPMVTSAYGAQPTSAFCAPSASTSLQSWHLPSMTTTIRWPLGTPVGCVSYTRWWRWVKIVMNLAPLRFQLHPNGQVHTRWSCQWMAFLWKFLSRNQANPK